MDCKIWFMPFSKLFKGIIFIGFVLFLISFPFNSASSNQEDSDTPFVEEKLRNQIARNGSTGYMIYFEDQPDLSAAYSKNWVERGEFVKNALQAAAEKSQQKVRDYLDKQGVNYESFWIENVIVVNKSNRMVFNRLLDYKEIESLRARRTMGLIEPGEASSATGTLAVEANISHVGAPSVWGFGYNGTGIVVANIDTGVRYTHQALLPHYRGNLGGGSFNHNYNWYDPYGSYTSYPADGNGHGSHTMGIMIGDDNSGNQIGMAPGAQWMACKGCEVFGSTTSCLDAQLLACAQFITAPTDLSGNNPDSSKRPNVVNNSWGDCAKTYDDWFQNAVDAWQAAGIYPVFSNGNASNCGYSSPPGLNTVGDPGRYGNVTSVGSTGKSDGAYANHSNWGPTDNADTVNPRGYPYLKPQVVAPGVSIRSAYKGSDTDYQSMNGTSMSAPHVAGLIALVWDAAPCLIGDYAHTETIIEESATAIPYATGGSPPPGSGNVPNYATGWGEINANAAVQLAINYCSNSLSGTVTNSSTSQAIEGVLVSAVNSFSNSDETDASGLYTILLPADIYTVTASKYGYFPEVDPNVNVSGSSTLNITLDPAPTATVSGVVIDETNGWPVYAKLTIDGYPGDPIWSDPISGQYSIELARGSTYTITVEDFWNSYLVEEVSTGLLSGNKTLNFSLNVNESVCSAPGYNLSYALYENFNSGTKPTGWSVVDNEGNGAVWTFNDPGSRSNLTGGSGLFADANSDHAGSYSMDTELRTPRLNLTGLAAPRLEFKYDWRVFGGSEVADVDISTNGSMGPWTNIWRKTTSSDRGPKTATIDLSSYGGIGNVMLRFHYYNAYWDWWWQVDDVNLYNCSSTAGGLIAGNVYNGIAALPMNGAEVSNSDGITTTSLATPDDANVDDGFYTIYSLAGSHPFTATMTGFAPEIDSVNVVSSDTVEHDFTLNPPLMADFTASPTSGLPPLTVDFTDTSTGTLTSWLWNFGDGYTDTLQSPSHMYSDVGVYTVTLNITGVGGSDEEVKPAYIAVAYPPVASFWVSPTIGIAPIVVNFTDTSTGTISTWMWNFGDGITSTLQNPNHLYSLGGVYTVSLAVVGPGGSDEEVKPNYISLLSADFSASPTFGHTPLTVNFTDDSTGTYDSWLWDFGDGITSTLQSPSHIYSGDGVYTVSLEVSGSIGSDREEKAGYIRIGLGSYLPMLIKQMLSAAGFP